jgi:hypothetical protein
MHVTIDHRHIITQNPNRILVSHHSSHAILPMNCSTAC